MDRSSFEASRRERAKQREAEGHPTPGDLAAYHAGRLTEERSGQIKDHLVACEDCTLLYDSLIEFEQYRPEPDASGADPSDAAWLRMRERLREEERAEAPASAPAQEEPRTAPVVPLQRRRVPMWQRPAVAWAVAAGLALCVVGLGIRSMTPPEPPAEQSEIGFRDYVPLRLLSAKRGNGEEEKTVVTIDPDVEAVDFEIPLTDPSPEATYEAALFRSEQEEPLWTRTKQESGEYLVVGVRRSVLVPGSYRFEVRKVQGNGDRTQVDSYSFNVP